MKSILIKKVKHIDRGIVDVFIDDGKFKQIDRDLNVEAGIVIEGNKKAILPSMYNSHTHAGMSIMRGAADDMKLFKWLHEYIWPLEKLRIDEDVYNAVRFACLEMIKSGTTFFSDMYEFYPMTLQATKDMGMKAMLGPAFFDFGKKKLMQQNQNNINETWKLAEKENDRIKFSIGAHAIYTVSKESLIWIRDFSIDNGVPIHIHISETEKEVKDCVAEHGLRPVEYLNKIGFFDADVFAAHSIWLNDNEIQIFKDHNVKAIHNPNSNQKLASGIFNFSKMKNMGVSVLLGTDSVASNNNLDMFEEMRSAALLAKVSEQDATVCSADEIFDAVTVNSAEAYGIDGGKITEGKVADCMLVDLTHYLLAPGWNLLSDIVYSANASCVDTVICDGKILMQNGSIDGEDEIIEKAREFMYRVGKDFK